MDGKITRKIKDFKYRFNMLEKRQKKILAIIAGIFIALILALVIVIMTSTFSVVKLSVADENFNLSGLNWSAKTGKIKKSDYAFYKFNSTQRNLIQNYYSEKSTAALKLKLQICPSKKQFETIPNLDSLDLPFMLGFLQENDFSSHGRLKFNKVGHVTIKGNLNQIFTVLKQNYEDGIIKSVFEFEVSFAIPKESAFREKENIPYGFYLYSALDCKIVETEITTATIGYDFSTDLNFYGFASNGGKLDFLSQTADFSGGSQIFPLNSAKEAMPVVTVKFTEDCAKSTLDGNVYVGANVGGEKIKIKCIDGLNQISFPAAGLSSPYAVVDLYKHKEFVSAILMETGNPIFNATDSSVVKPIKTDPGLILDWNQKNWRNKDFEVYNWDRFPDILFFDIRDLKTQEKFFSRLAYFVEKEGYKGRVLSNEELEGKHGYNAHDYSAESMASFFNKAYSINFNLNPEEEILKNILLDNGLLLEDTENKGYVKAGNGGLVSISKETPGWSRKRLLAHEGWHTLYFADDEFRNFVAACFYTMDYKSRDFLIGFFRSQPSLGYDVNDSYLLNNEFMAYVLQQPLNQVAGYFTSIAGWPSVVKAQKDLCNYIKSTNASAFEDVAVMMNDYLFSKWGIESGSISLITFE